MFYSWIVSTFDTHPKAWTNIYRQLNECKGESKHSEKDDMG
jgi:hypothetical protein